MEPYFDFGVPHVDQKPERLRYEAARHCLAAVLASRNFDLVGIADDPANERDVLVVDCWNEGLGSQNPSGIRNMERIALVFPKDSATAPHGPQVRPLRRSFPRGLIHLNHVAADQPAWLCLHAEPWGTVRRHWTPQAFLRRILWWFDRSSAGELHQPDQPLEGLYLEGEVMEIVLPPDFVENYQTEGAAGVRLRFSPCAGSDTNTMLRGNYCDKTHGDMDKWEFVPLVLELGECIHGAHFPRPSNLGELRQQLESRGLNLGASLPKAIQAAVPEGTGWESGSKTRPILILPLQIRRSKEESADIRVQLLGFVVDTPMADLGRQCGVLQQKAHNGYFYRECLLGAPAKSGDLNLDDWNKFPIFPTDVRFALTKEMARHASGVSTSEADFSGMLAGVGALGGLLAELWAKAAWGKWTIVDGDYVKPHNVARHVARDKDVGRPKVDVVRESMEANYSLGYRPVRTSSRSLADAVAEGVLDGDAAGTLWVDATTSLEVPRDMAASDSSPRCVSVFLTPSGKGSVLLLENHDRSIRLDALEAQYYRALIRNEWGEQFLSDPTGAPMWVGARCRDVSSSIPNDMVHTHAGLLAGQIRRLVAMEEARIGVWNINETSGGIDGHWVAISPVISCQAPSGWTIQIDEGVIATVQSMRKHRLPNETGGIILGFVDQILKMIHVVDVLPAPTDSIEEPTGFIRGCKGLIDSVNRIMKTTAHIVEYLGEWHSHPRGASVAPSMLDLHLFQEMRNQQSTEGKPAIMMIISDDNINLMVDKQPCTINRDSRQTC